MTTDTEKQIRIDLDHFKLHLNIEKKIQLSLHFDTPSRKFYLSTIALVLNEMKKNQCVKSIPLKEHHKVLVLLNETVGGFAGSSKKEKLISRIYKKWKTFLPNLEDAPLFRIIGRKKEYGSGIEKAYVCSEDEKDSWANLFEYKGSGESVSLRFSVDALDVDLDNSSVIYKGNTDGEAWERFIFDLNKDWEVKAIPEKTDKKPEKTVGKKKSREKIWRQFALVAIIAIIVVAVGLLSWNAYRKQSQQVVAASVERMAYPLPEKPSIAVLPFVNMSGDSEQEYLSDGITEQIITALSQSPDLFVISRSSTFTYKGKSVKVQQVSKDLGVRYVLEGSVQIAGDKVRITAQLIDAKMGQHLWADYYDRELKDIFTLQDEITIKIMSSLEVKLLYSSEREHSYTNRTKNLKAFLKYMQANTYQARGTPEDWGKAYRLAKESITLDPEYSAPYFILAWAHMMEAYSPKNKSPHKSMAKAFEMAQKVLAKDESNPKAHDLLGDVYSSQGEYEKAIAEYERAAELDPNDPWGYMSLGYTLTSAGRPQEAILLLKKSMRLSPLSQTHASMCLYRLGRAYRTIGQYEEALSALNHAKKIRPDSFLIHMELAATYIHLGREEEARAAATEVLRTLPAFSLEVMTGFMAYKNPVNQEIYVEALRKAGLK